MFGECDGCSFSGVQDELKIPLHMIDLVHNQPLRRVFRPCLKRQWGAGMKAFQDHRRWAMNLAKQAGQQFKLPKHCQIAQRSGVVSLTTIIGPATH